MSKRLNSKLDSIEQQTGTDSSLTPAAKKLLVQLLARRDAMFWPWRITLTYRPPLCEIRTRQREYVAGVAGIAAKASGAGDWKTAHDLRNELIAAGMTTAVRSGGQITSQFLTAKGEATGRALVGDYLATYHDEGAAVLARLKALVDETGVSAVAETVLWGRPCYGDPSAWNWLTERILPCIVAGLVRVEPDTVGRIVFIPVDDVPEPERIDVDVQADETFLPIYLKAWDNERATLERCEPRDTDEIFVPNPAHYPFNFCDVSAGENTDEE
jgi:hypothetical protein